MSKEYDKYIKEHKVAVMKAYTWLLDNYDDVLKISKYPNLKANLLNHDTSKYSDEEYDAYDKYFYGGNRSYAVVEEFRRAWLHHIHVNPHHWQYWVLINDDPTEGIVALDMPDEYIIEMICDWWSFSWRSGDLAGVFKWYDDHKKYMQLSERTRSSVELILSMIEYKLD
jgi:hypothetical protein|nr:MAG TPA: hypothetical protein [Caudoviricetes sp.]